MEFINAPLNKPSQGDCEGCARKAVALTAVVLKVEPHPTKKYATGGDITIGKKAHLICEECATSHPLWRLDQPDREREKVA